ncbi:MAG TPA: hemerythrin domain-containing protein [Gammaproteobacteria bacterium]|nr:hemerythrin domain-containing protein [Gammaproteobacteria bacterium]
MTAPLTPELPGFDDPVAVLRACHERMLDHCDLLERLVAHVTDKGPDREASCAAAKVYRYFTTAARHHHQDEEQDLFPVLARQSMKIADLAFALRKDHERLDALWNDLEPALRRVQDIEGNADFAARAAEFCQLTRTHVEKENCEFLPQVQHSLSSRQLQDIGRAMEKRRRHG